MTGSSTDSREAASLRLTEEDARALLTRCLERRVPAVITSSDASLAYQARFATQEDRIRAVTFDILGEVDRQFGGYNSYVVTFYQEGRAWLFVSQLRDAREASEGTPPRLVLLRPSHVVRTDLRQDVRVRVAPDSGLQLAMTDQELASLTPRVVDLGLGGMSIEFSKDRVPDFPLGAAMSLTICHAGARINMLAEVRHRDGERYGLSFQEGAEGEALTLSGPFQAILSDLERRWYHALGQG
jgi:PilZ domain